MENVNFGAFMKKLREQMQLCGSYIVMLDRSLPKVAAKFPDVYSVLGLSGPVVPVSVWLSELPPDKRRVFAEAWEEALGYISDAGVEIDTPKGADIINKVLARYGL